MTTTEKRDKDQGAAKPSPSDDSINFEQKPKTPLFLARETYRRRRIMDAARLLPALGAALVLMPVLWVPGNETAGTARGVVYLFLVWLGLILSSVVISRRLKEPLGDRDRGQRSDDGIEEG